MANDTRWCFAWLHRRPADPRSARTVVQRTVLWNPGESITISFMAGDARLKRRIRDAALEWVSLASLRLIFVESDDADVRIGLWPGHGSWSAIGTTCRDVPDGLSTMNFGWLDAACSDRELRSVVLHEFGHVLGLAHSHQNVAAGMSWDRDAVLRNLT